MDWGRGRGAFDINQQRTYNMGVKRVVVGGGGDFEKYGNG